MELITAAFVYYFLELILCEKNFFQINVAENNQKWYIYLILFDSRCIMSKGNYYLQVGKVTYIRKQYIVCCFNSDRIYSNG